MTSHNNDQQRQRSERRTLSWVLLINLTQSLVLFGLGLAADSTALLGSANLADAAVYGVSIYAVGRALLNKVRAARLSGALLLVLGLGLLIEVLRRFFAGAEPIGYVMILAALANAAVNLINLRLLRSHREEGVHLKASWIFTTNDMIANAGIAASGLAVMLLQSSIPDLLIGILVACIALKGAWEILENARQAKQ